ncbi:hypothetical protein SAMN05443637_111107 [Pseudonocardia thermophila]|uniref:Uncharacterized protein n=1 Tax=Pseudonocardia thermophila TaxID=1848 RepID=A0A1M6UZQ4_PSETH|nr:hypothetical protein [Pseudonocardia thermophila]SHK74641.1 hypothetical protein SAMN05443637_111107 [Pseudonocardia thermophila]
MRQPMRTSALWWHWWRTATAAEALGFLVPAAIGAALTGVAGGLLLGTALLASIGTAQWLVLRRVVLAAAWWIPATAAAWVAGLLAFATVTGPLWQSGQPGPLVAAIGALGGLVMAAVVAALTGWAATRLPYCGHRRTGTG